MDLLRERQGNRQGVKEKDAAISYIRFIAMVLIVSCHFSQYYENELAWYLNVGVQIFFVISGFLYSNKEIAQPIDFITKRAIKILVPYYVFVIPTIVLYVLFQSAHISIVGIINLLCCTGTTKGIEHLWFVIYILFCYVITPYLYYIRKKIEECSFIKCTLVLLIFIGGYIVITTLTNAYFKPSRVCCYIIGYFIGVYRQKFHIKLINPMTILFIIVAWGANAILIYLKYFSEMQSGIISKFMTYVEPYGHLLLGISLFLILYKVFQKWRASKLTVLSDQYSYSVYLVHQLFILSPFALMNVTSNLVLNWCLVILAIIVASMIVKVCSDKIMKCFT